MKNLKILCALMILIALTACDDKATQSSTAVQQVPEANSSTQLMNELSARLIDNPNDFNALSTLGDVYFEAGRYLEAINTYDRAIEVNPMCADCFNDKGLALHYLSDSDAAIAAFDQAVTIDPTYVHAWLSKGFVLVVTGRYEEAVEPLNKVKELDSGGLAAEADKFLGIIAEQQPQ